MLHLSRFQAFAATTPNRPSLRQVVAATICLTGVAACGDRADSTSADQSVPFSNEIVTTTTWRTSVPVASDPSEAPTGSQAATTTTVLITTTTVVPGADVTPLPVTPVEGAVGSGSVLLDETVPVNPNAPIIDYTSINDEMWSECSVVAVGTMTRVIINAYAERSSDADVAVALPAGEQRFDGLVFELSEVLKASAADVTSVTVLVNSSQIADGVTFRVDDDIAALASPGMSARPGEVPYLLCLTEWPNRSETFVPYTPAGLSPTTSDGLVLNAWFDGNVPARITLDEVRELVKA